MSNHFAKPEWNIHNVSSCTGNHTLHAAGLGRALKKNIVPLELFTALRVKVRFSEGYCYEAINGADKEKLPVVFIFQDNGYGISVPKEIKQRMKKLPITLKVFLTLQFFTVTEQM